MLSPAVLAYRRYLEIVDNLQQTELMVEDCEPDMRDLVTDEVKSLRVSLNNKSLIYLLYWDPDDDRNVYLEIRAGTGGDEAALLLRPVSDAYQFYAQKQRGKWQVVHASDSEQGGFKEVKSMSPASMCMHT